MASRGLGKTRMKGFADILFRRFMGVSDFPAVLTRRNNWTLMLCYERLTDRLTVSRTTPTIAMAFRALKACATRFGTPSRRMTRPRLFAHREIRSRARHYR